MTCDCKVLGGESCHMGDGCKATETMAREALQQSGNHPAPCARSCEANAYEIQIRQLSAERDALAADLANQRARALSECDRCPHDIDNQKLLEERAALAAKLAELEGQEPVAWLNPYGGALLSLSTGLERSTYTIPLFSRPVPAQPVNARLLEAVQDLLAYHADIAVDPRVSGADAKLVEQAKAEEREACAKVCDELFPPPGEQMAVEWAAGTIACANAIRARGKK